MTVKDLAPGDEFSTVDGKSFILTDEQHGPWNRKALRRSNGVVCLVGIDVPVVSPRSLTVADLRPGDCYMLPGGFGYTYMAGATDPRRRRATCLDDGCIVYHEQDLAVTRISHVTLED